MLQTCCKTHLQYSMRSCHSWVSTNQDEPQHHMENWLVFQQGEQTGEWDWLSPSSMDPELHVGPQSPTWSLSTLHWQNRWCSLKKPHFWDLGLSPGRPSNFLASTRSHFDTAAPEGVGKLRSGLLLIGVNGKKV